MVHIQDTLTYADGSKVNGRLVVSWNAFTLGAATVAGGMLEYEIVDGALSLTLYANTGALPTGSYYTAKFELESGAVYTEQWMVPNFITVNLGQIRVSFPPTPSVLISPTQLTSVGARPGMFLQWEGTRWNPAFPSTFNLDPNYINIAVANAGNDVEVIGSPVTVGATVTINIPSASLTARGVVTTGDQTFAGNKHFTGTTTIDNLVVAGGSGIVPSTRRINTDATLYGGGPLSADLNMGVNPDSHVQRVRVSKSGVLTGTRRELNFIQGTGITLTLVDNGGANAVNVQVDCTVIGGVSSVFGRSGVVTAQTGDYTAAMVTDAVSVLGAYADPGWITALAWAKLSGVPATFPPSAHVHDASAITSGIMATARLGSGTADATTFLRGDGQWAVVSGGGGSDPTLFLGDLIVRDTAAVTRLGIGSNGQVLTVDMADPLRVKWATPTGGGGGMSDPTTTLGDLIVRGASATTRLPVGINGQVLTADSLQTTGVKWGAPTNLTFRGSVANYASLPAWPVAAKYWQVYISSLINSDYGEIREIQFYDDAGARILGGTASGSANYGGATYAPATCFDNDPSTYFSAASPTPPFFVTYQFPAPVLPATFRFLPTNRGGGPKDWKLRTSSDGSNWKDVAVFTGWTMDHTFSDWAVKPANGFLIWRLRTLASKSGNCGLAELEFRATVGGADLTASGVFAPYYAIASYAQPFYWTEQAFDNDPTKTWFGGTSQGWIGWMFERPVNIRQIAITNGLGGSDASEPTSFLLEASNNAGATWTIIQNYTTPDWNTGVQETRLFDVPLPPATNGGLGPSPGDAYTAMDTGHLWMWNGAVWVDCGLVTGIGGGHTIQDEGTALTQRVGLNFVGAAVTVTDDAANNRTVVTIAASGHTIQDEGSALTQRSGLNFVGAGVTATDDSANNRTLVTIPGGAAQTPWTSNIEGAGFNLQNAGRIGIGTGAGVTPSASLHVKKGAAGFAPFSATAIFVENAGGAAYVETACAAAADSCGYLFSSGTSLTSYIVDLSTNLQFVTTGARSHMFVAGASERMRIASTGNVGIGTTNPGVPLDIVGGSGVVNLIRIQGGNASTNNSFITFRGKNAAADLWYIGSDVTNTNTRDFNFYDVTASTQRVTIQQSTGHVGIGTMTPYGRLSVLYSSATPPSLTHGTAAHGVFAVDGSIELAVFLNAGTSPYPACLQVRHNTVDGQTYPLSLNPLGGNVGIGTTSPASALEVNGDITLPNTKNLLFKNAAGAAQTFLYKSPDNSFQIQQSSNAPLKCVINGGPFNVSQQSGADLVTVLYSGNVGIGTTGPTNRLTVQGTDGGAVTDYAVQWLNSAATLGYLGADPVNYNSGALYLYKNGAANTKISALGDSFLMGGNVGIGISPATTLHVYQAAAGVCFRVGTNGGVYEAGSPHIQFFYANSEFAKIYMDGSYNTVIDATQSPGTGSIILKPKASAIQTVVLGSSAALTTTMADIAGMSLTLPTAGRYLILATFGMNPSGDAALIVDGTVNVAGTDQAGGAEFASGNASVGTITTSTAQWVITVSAGAVVKMRGKKSTGTLAMFTGSITVLTAIFIGA